MDGLDCIPDSRKVAAAFIYPFLAYVQLTAIVGAHQHETYLLRGTAVGIGVLRIHVVDTAGVNVDLGTECSQDHGRMEAALRDNGDVRVGASGLRVAQRIVPGT